MSSTDHQPSEAPAVRLGPEVIKSLHDPRQYRTIVLPNNLHVVLISDATADVAAASMSVRVGHFSDPWDVPGLAHFCEHMLFLGTEKYPDENSYNSFLSQHGGGSNAFTSTENTTYYFSVLAEYLQEGLDRFSQFFIAPLFTEDATDRELNAVHSENQKNLQTDAWREFQLIKSLSRDDHVFHKFGTGNLRTLKEEPAAKGINIREQLLAFHKAYYSAGTMKLAILGKQTLDELQSWTVEYFSPILDLGIAPTSFASGVGGGMAFGTEQVMRRVDFVPVKDLRQVELAFPAPSMRHHVYSKPLRYWSHLIGHEGKGSILSFLKEKGWGNELSAGESRTNTAFQFFIVTITLTDEGFEHLEEVVDVVFQYIRMLKNIGIQRWVFDEVAKVNLVDFQFMETKGPDALVLHCVGNMLWHSDELAVVAPNALREFNEELLNELFSYLVPSNLLMLVASQHFEGQTDRNEQYYGTAHRVTPLSSEQIKRWSYDGPTIEGADKLHLPQPNIFLPDEFELRQAPDVTVQPPTVILSQPNAKLWHSSDTSFKEPRGNYRFHMLSPETYKSPRSSCLTQMLERNLSDQLNEFSYIAEVAGLTFSVIIDTFAVSVLVSGYNQKLPVLVHSIFDKLRTFKCSPSRFAVLKEQYMRDLENLKMEPPYSISRSIVILDTSIAWTAEQELAAVQKLTPEDLDYFVHNNLLPNLMVEGFSHGNISEDESKELFLQVLEKLNNPPPLYALPENRIVRLEPGFQYIHQLPVKNPEENNSAIYYLIQIGAPQTSIDIKLDLLDLIGSEPAFDTLRTKEQLGYIVWSGARKHLDIQWYYVRIQSVLHDPTYLHTRIEHFLAWLLYRVKTLTNEEFQKYVSSLISKKEEKDLKLIDRTRRWYYEITERTFQFDRVQRCVAALRALTHREFVAFCERHLSPTQNAVLSIQIFGQNKPIPAVSDSKPEYVVYISEPDTWKKTLSLFPTLR